MTHTDTGTSQVDAWIALNNTEEDSTLLVIDGQPFTHLIPICQF